MTARNFRLTPPPVYELELHETLAKVLDVVLLPPAVWATYPAGATQLSPQQHARYSRVGLKRGWPDIIVIHGRVFGLELKRYGAGLSRTRIGRTRRGSPRIYEGQADVFRRLEAAGMTIGVARSVDEALALLRGWGVPLRASAA